jgi:hypothetical protein
MLALLLTSILTSALLIQTSLAKPESISLERWAVIEEDNGDRLKVETVQDKIWSQLVQLYHNRSHRWIGGKVEEYVNEWDFRFDPNTIIVENVTIEVCQTTIQQISENLDYWLGQEKACVWAKVVLINPVPVVWEDVTYLVAISTNSTISAFQFNQPQMQIGFNVTGLSGTVGYCNVTIPHTLLGGPYSVFLDNSSIDFSETSNDTHTFLYFTYTHASPSRITIQGTTVIPEFPSIIILPLFVALFVLAILFKRRLPRKLKSNHKLRMNLIFEIGYDLFCVEGA